MTKEIYISTDKSLLDIDFIHDYMTKKSYWAKERTLVQTERTIENSFCFGMYANSKKQIGFARVVTDFTFFGNIMDVIIDPRYQGEGLGKSLMDYVFKGCTCIL